MYGIIYRAICKVNGKVYIGLTTKTLTKRIKGHIKASKNDKYDRKHCAFHNAIRKYGIENFDITIIDTADSCEELNEKEQYWIAYYDCMVPNGYNMTLGGGGTSGFKMPDDAKKKISAFQKTQPHTPEWNRKVSEAQKGHANHIQTDSEKQKRSNSLKGTWADGKFVRNPNANKGGRPIMTEAEREHDSEINMGKKHMRNDTLCVNLVVFRDEVESLVEAGWEFKYNKDYRRMTRKEARELGII